MSQSALVLDRFVSASNAEDASQSLRKILNGLQTQTDNDQEEDVAVDPQLVWGDNEILEALLQVLTSGQYKDLIVEEGSSLVCQIYKRLFLYKDSLLLLQKPQPARLVQSLLDVLSSNHESAYTRVLSMQVLHTICQKAPSVAQTQLLEVPNGLHRLADTLREEEEEQVRNEALLLAKVVAKWPSCAKIWVFADVCDTVVEFAVQEGGLTQGSVLVMDCLDVLCCLLQHDASLSDLVWQSPSFPPKLASLLDLRRGVAYLHPKPSSSNNDDDDLDDLLRDDNDENSVVPRLTDKEEAVLRNVFALLGIMLGSETIRRSVWKRHVGLGSLVWELALLTLPPPGTRPACAVPSSALQQLGLESVAEFFASNEMMERHNGLDRLLYLVCTGGSGANTGLSQAALHVIRQTLPHDTANQIVMHTLAPPIANDDNPEPTVLIKLLNTVLENLNSGGDRRRINLLGSLGALGVFLFDSTTREMFLRIASPHSLVDKILQTLESQEEAVALGLLRFLCEWIVETPPVVEAVLSCTESTALGVAFGKNAVLAGLFLGMAMEYMDERTPEKYGGWTRSSILSMISKRKGGVSGFMGELEQFKRNELPWSACHPEHQHFFAWYTQQVLVVRSRIVQEMTGGYQEGGDDNDDGNNDEGLQRLVAHQSKELDEMRNALKQAENTIATQASQLDVWKRRVESTPSQLDEMLTEYVSKNEHLEDRVSSLMLEAKTKEDTYDENVRQKQDRIHELETAVQGYETRERAANEERDSLREELAALSAAYANLESEYNQQVTTTPTGEDADAGERPAGQQPQGEGSSQGQAGSDLEELRAENARLHSDARAADEWMAMAVQRMNEVGNQNVALQEEVVTLRRRLGEDGQDPPEEASSSELQSERKRRQDLEAKLESLLQGDDVSSLRTQVESLQTELQIARAETTALNEERRQLENQLQTTEGELESSNLEASLPSKEQESHSLKERIKSLQEELAESRSQMELLLKKSQDKPRDEEIQQLRDANDAAQEWMSKAVEHHQALSQKVSALSDDKRALVKQIEDLETQVSGKDADALETKRLEEELKVQEEEVGRLRAEMDELQQELEKKELEIERLGEESSAAATEITRLEEEASQRAAGTDEQLRGELESSQAKCRFLESEVSSMATDNASKDREMETARASAEKVIAELRSEVAEKEQHISKLSAQGANDAANLQMELSNMHTSYERLQAEHAESTTRMLDSHNTRLQDLRSELEDKFREKEKALLDSMHEMELRAQERTDTNSSLTAERDSLTEQLASSQSRLEEFQSWSESAQQKLAGLLSENQALETSVAKYQQELKDAKTSFERELEKQTLEAASSLEAQLQSFADRASQLEAGNNALQARNKSLEEHLEAAMTERSAMEATMKRRVEELEVSRSELQEANSESEQLSRDWKDKAMVMESAVGELERALEEQRNEATDALNQWSARCAELEISASTLQGELDAARGSLAERESTVAEQEKALESQQKEASEAVEEWSARCTELEEKLSCLEEASQRNESEKQDLSERLGLATTNLDAATERIRSLEKELGVTLSGHNEAKSFWQSELEGMKKSLEEREAHLATHQERARQLEAHSEELETKLKSAHEENTKVQEEWNGKSSELESAISELEKMLEQQKDDATTAIAEWVKHSSTLDEKVADLEKELHVTRENLLEHATSLEEVQAHLDESAGAREAAERGFEEMKDQCEEVTKQSEDAINQWQERVGELETSMTELENQLSLQQEEANEVILQWEEKCNSLEERNELVLEEAMNNSRSLLSLLVGHIRDVGEKLHPVDGQENEGGAALSNDDVDKALESKESLTALQDSVESGLVNTKKRLQEAISKLSVEIKENKAELSGCHQNIQQQAQEISRMKEEVGTLRETTSKQNKELEKFKELQEKHTDLQASLLGQQENAAALHEKIEGLNQDILGKEKERQDEQESRLALEQKLASLETDKSKVETELDGRVKALAKSQEEMQKLETRLTDTENTLAETKSRVQMASSEKSRVEEALEAERLLASENEAKWKEGRQAAASEKATLEKKLSTMQREIGRLEAELRDAGDTLQTRITDEISLKATEMATQALRRELSKLRMQTEGDRRALESERKSRMAFEEEARRLKSDLALVLGVDEHSESSEKTRNMVWKVADQVQRKERMEIDELRDALERSVRELATARAAETDATERATAARLQISVQEQEIIAAKADVKFLTQTLEEMRESEATRVASFEYRIGTLEDDKEVVRRSHADGLETLRNELAHASMEKDRILHLLKESEKNNAALVYSTTREREEGVIENAALELSRLRASNAQLLAAAAEAGARTERRIREAVAASASLFEADVILERELRASTETALEDLKAQLMGPSRSKEAVDSERKVDKKQAAADQLRAELEKLREQGRKLAEENEQLKKESRQTRDELEARVLDLTEECREAQARAHKLEQGVQFDAEVHAEVTKMQSKVPEADKSNKWIVVNHPVEDPGPPGGLSHADSFDYIMEQRIAIHEERQMYQELLSEHDDLLALLAQQDLEKTTLNVALAKYAGQEAVDIALLEARESAIEQFGRYVQIT